MAVLVELYWRFGFYSEYMEIIDIKDKYCCALINTLIKNLGSLELENAIVLCDLPVGHAGVHYAAGL